MSRHGSVRRLAPYRYSARFRARRVPRKWRHRLEPPSARALRPRGLPGLWTRVRRLIWAWWPWGVATVWALVVDAWNWSAFFGVMAFVTYLSAPRERPPTYGLDHDIPADDPAFLDSVVGLTGIAFLEGNQVVLLNNGDEFYPSMLRAIGEAQESITIEAYIYWAGAIGLEFAHALAAKAHQGVTVKILLDAVGSSSIGTEILETLEAGGCQLAWFNPIKWYSIGQFNYRTHRKSLIVDGRIGFTGGAGIADHWAGHAQDPAHWRDMQIRIEGPGVMPLQTGFARNWQQTTGELVSGPAYFPPPEAAGRVPLHTVLSSPSTGASAARTLYYFAIVCARRSIHIANPYFVPDQTAIDALVDAARRGVRVRILVSGRYNDNFVARRNSVRLFGDLLSAGVEIFEYNRTMLHYKTMVVDGAWGTIGTTNFDNRSFAFNEESNVSFVDRRLVGELEEAFEGDRGASDRLTVDAWQKRGVWARAQEAIVWLLQDQV
jgi:cardiolipin synthase